MLAVALPNAGLLQAGNMLGAALGAAYNAIRPPERNHLRLAILKTAEVDDCLLKSLDAVHILIMAVSVGSVKYIIALVSSKGMELNSVLLQFRRNANHAKRRCTSATETGSRMIDAVAVCAAGAGSGRTALRLRRRFLGGCPGTQR